MGFAHTVGEFGVVLMIGGSISGQTRVVSVQIYDHVDKIQYAAAHWLAVSLFGLTPGSPAAESVEFFFYDTAKILLLLVSLIYAIAWARAGLNVERVRDYLSGKARGLGYFLGSSFGAITPFCSCSA